MSWLNSLAGAAQGVMSGQGGAVDATALMGLATQLIEQFGGLQALLEKLQAGGLADAAASWVGSGPNLPVSAEQLQQAIGADTLNQLAQNAGLDPQAVAGGLADFLPGLVDQLTPSGQIPADGAMGALQGILGGSTASAGGLLGGLFQR